MSIVVKEYAFVGVDYEPSIGCGYAKFDIAEYDGTNSADIAAWATDAAVIDNSGTLEVVIRASACPWAWASKFQGQPVTAEVPSGSYVVFQGNTFFGLLDSGYLAEAFAELA